jgi:hypothetical protein
MKRYKLEFEYLSELNFQKWLKYEMESTDLKSLQTHYSNQQTIRRNTRNPRIYEQDCSEWKLTNHLDIRDTDIVNWILSGGGAEYITRTQQKGNHTFSREELYDNVDNFLYANYANK